jgi:protein-S-isoprenylcysteine O-methyltransferase Ste14
VWLYLLGRPYTSLAFRTPLPYNVVRHPLYIGWAIAFWATPMMTLGHLLFALLLSVYMFAASRVEERDLIAHFGHLYEDYRRRVPAFLPLPRLESRKQFDRPHAEA